MHRLRTLLRARAPLKLRCNRKKGLVDPPAIILHADILNYKSLLKTVKAKMLEQPSSGYTIKRTRQNRKGDLLLKTTTENDIIALSTVRQNRLQGMKVDIATVSRRQIIKLRGLDAITTAKEVQDAISSSVDDCSSDDVKILKLHIYKWQETLAVVSVPAKVADALILAGRVIVG